MNKQLVLPVVLGVIVFGLGFSPTAHAANNFAQGETLVHLTTITPSDLGVDSVGTLPTSPFYFFKEWKRGITRLFTFDSVAKAQLELNITNQIAAEVLEVNKANPDDVGALKNALNKFTDAQERLRFRITTINGTSNVTDSESLLKAVDEKTAKHAVLLEQIVERWSNDPYAEDSARKGSIGDPDFDLLAKGLEDAQDNILKTLTITVTSVNDAPSLKQKAADQIASATAEIEEANDVLMQVSTTRGMWRPSTDDSTATTITVPKQTQGTTFGDKVKTGGSAGGESDIFDRWGNSITKAKSHLANAKAAFAEGKYGEAYGLARSAEALTTGIGVAVGDLNGDGKPDIKTKPSPSTTTPKEKIKINENESPRPTDRAKAAPKATTGSTGSTTLTASSSPQATPEDEKTETAQPSGGSAGPASNYDRDN